METKVSRMNKKGSILDLIYIMVILLFFSFVVLIGYKVMDEINTNVQASSIIDSNGKTASTNLLGKYTGVVDNTYLLLTIGLAAGMLVLASMVRVHPIFIPIYLIALLFFIFISGIFSNIYQEAAESTVLAEQAAQLTIITNIMTYLPMFTAVFGTLLMVVMYKLWSAANESYV